MTKFNRNYYYTSKREKKLNCYYINIPRVIVEKADMQDKDLEIKEENGKIIIDKLQK